MTSWAIGYVAAGLAFLALDGIWLGLAAPMLYRPAMGGLLAERFRPGAALAFYIVYIAGILLFAVAPALRATSPVQAALLGAALGAVAYATYDFTNLATLRDWPARIALIDLGWGMIVTGAAALAGYWAMSIMARPA